jgi:hypothetical protein
MTARTSAFLLRLFGIVAAILLAAFAGFGPSVLAKDTPGNNGTVKIHDGADENANGEVRNEPHVCTFHLHFYFADPVQSGSWEIQEWAPTGTKGTVVMSGTYDTAGDGEDRQARDGRLRAGPGPLQALLGWRHRQARQDEGLLGRVCSRGIRRW